MPFTGVMMVGGMCLHGAGETTRPSLIAVGVNVVNIVFAYALSGVDLHIGGHTLHNPFPFHWNVTGIAAGAALSSVFGAIATLAVVFAGIAVGVAIGTHWPGIDPARLAPQWSWEFIARPYAFLLLPNILWLAGCFFVLAALSRQMAPVYIAGVVVLLVASFLIFTFVTISGDPLSFLKM